MGYRFVTPALIAAVCLAVGCDEPNPTEVTPPLSDQQFAVTTNEKDVPFTMVSPNEVCGDRISIEGTDHWVIKRTETPSGRIQWSWRSNYSGTAVGTPSGNTWDMTGTYGYQEVIDGNDGFPWVVKYQDRMVLVGRGQSPNITSHIYWHVTVNPSGEWVVVRWWLPVEPTCQGY